MQALEMWSIRLTIVCIVVFILQTIFPSLTDSLSLVSSDLLARPWILLTSMFAHGSLEHLIYNMFALALFGSILESIIGSKRWLTVYFVSGIVAGLVAAFFYPASLGASGAIFGLLGALAMIRPKMSVWVSGIPMPMAIAAAVWAAGDLVGLFVPSGIANAAHLGGLAIGIVSGIFWRKKFAEKIIRREHGPNIDEGYFRSWERRWL